MTVPAERALQQLVAGNLRFSSDKVESRLGTYEAPRHAQRQGQDPYAVVLGCADSRVPPEILFDQGLGELFVVRVAGNLATAEVIGSVEFAVARLGVRLVVVLGHTGCGIVEAALGSAGTGEDRLPRHLAGVVERVRTSLEPARKDAAAEDPGQAYEKAVHAHIRAEARRLRASSEALKALEERGDLQIVEALYRLESGRVEF